MTTTPDHKPQTDDAPTPRHSRLCAVLTLIGLVGVALWGFATLFTPATTDDDAADALPISDEPAPDDADFAMPDMPAAPVAARPDSAAVANDSTAADTAAAEPHVVPADSVPAPKPEPLPEPLPLPADTADA